ncbi:MAG TPA: ABC transporter ATP-binding protein [Rectinemataceae bacterium]|nr:ABC transporter ATP-binding protein [Rectinemataceae bacterium]
MDGQNQYVVRLNDVHKSYALGKTEVLALQGVSFDILKGDFISIAGPSGSGKTTVLNLIGCVDTASSGGVTILGQRTDSLGDEKLTALRHKGIGFIFQTFNLIPVLNIRENVELPALLDGSDLDMPKNERQEWVDHLIESVGLADRMKHKPAELSGGQRQRIAIARALVMRPPIVLADEPTANLDSATGESILALMKRMNREFGTTFIFSTHDQGIVDIADHVIRLKDGRIVENYRAEEKASS